MEEDSNSQTEEAHYRSGFVALVGPANAGKSTLLNALVGTKVSIVSPRPQTTRRRIQGIKTTPTAQLIFVDTPGLWKASRERALERKLAAAFSEAAADVDLSLLVIDAAAAADDRGELEALAAALRKAAVRNLKLIVLNKIDLVAKPQLLPLLDRALALFSPFSPEQLELVPLSARTGDGLPLLLELITRSLPEGPPLFPEDTVTDQADEHFAAEIIREKLLFQLQDELPYSIAVRVDAFDDVDDMLHIHGTILVERPSQKPIVIGSGGTMLKKIGEAAREELERIYGSRVFLKLFVRIEPDWTKTERGLKRAGL